MRTFPIARSSVRPSVRISVVSLNIAKKLTLAKEQTKTKIKMKTKTKIK